MRYLLQERRIAESLFLPPKPERKLNVQKGARVSRRIQMQQQEKAATKELAGMYAHQTRRVFVYTFSQLSLRLR